MRALLDANLYMTVATAGEDGVPWVSPVYFAHDEYTRLYWVSDPGARHSRNIAARPAVAIVVFDSRAAIGSAAAVYMAAEAAEASDDEHGLAVFSARSVEHGAGPWGPERVRPPAKHRLYRATVSQHWMLGPGDERIPMTPYGDVP